MKILSARTVYFFLFLFASCVLGASIYLQMARGIQLCPLCVIQRGLFLLLAVTCFIAWMHNPAGKGQSIYRGTLFGLTILGILTAGRQLWIQALPNGSISCGADIYYLLQTLPLHESLLLLFKGTAECHDKGPQILFLTISEWSLVCFVLFFVILFASKFRSKTM